jgi:hypothetical protein
LRITLAGGRIFVADDLGPVAALFSPPPEVTGEARRLVLFALVAPGVPQIAVEEALWTAWDVIDSA